tara:strand:- start:1011 stop:1772 length:762 start_codon:yes stop_codon:yes gene_type:complete
MISVDTVYQKVLAMANKEQRGYITPQEFNLFADKVQMEIFENYFHDLKTAYYKVKNENSYSDEISMLYEKLQFFKQEGQGNTYTALTGTEVFNTDLVTPTIYRLDTLSCHELDESGNITNSREFTELNKKEITQALRNPLTTPTSDRPVFVRESDVNSGLTTNRLRLYPTFVSDSNITISYWRRPQAPRWAFVVVNGQALFNAGNANNFELHPAEEEQLVTRILAISGIAMTNMELAQVATVDEGNIRQKQND